MIRLQFLAILFLVSTNAWGQTNHDSTFALRLKQIDAYIFSIDTFKSAVDDELVGELDFGAFEGSCLHDESVFLIHRIRFDFDTTTTKTFYFENNKLIKIVDGKSEFYNLEKWFDKNGNAVETTKIDKLLLLSLRGLDIVRKLFYQRSGQSVFWRMRIQLNSIRWQHLWHCSKRASVHTFVSSSLFTLGSGLTHSIRLAQRPEEWNI